MTNLEIRVGFEIPSSDSPRLLNGFCGYVWAPFSPNNSNVTVFSKTLNGVAIVNVSVGCLNGTLRGRFITIQKMDCGQLEIYDVTILPNPGKIL